MNKTNGQCDGISAAIPAPSSLRYKCNLSVDIPTSSERVTSSGRNSIYFPYESSPTLVVGRLCWTMRASLITTIKTAEIKFTRCTAGPKDDRQMVKSFFFFFSLFFFSNATTCPLRLRGPPHPRLWLKCTRVLRLGRPVGAVTLSR